MTALRSLSRAGLLVLCCAFAACSADLAYDPYAPADAVESCMLLEQALCERRGECRNTGEQCSLETFRETCVDELADHPCREAIGDQLLQCYDRYRNFKCDDFVVVGCPTYCF